MGRGLAIGFGQQPYTLQCAPGAFNLLGYDAALPTSGALKGFAMTGLPGKFVFTGQTSSNTVGGTFPTATPTFSVATGTYPNAQRVSMSCSTSSSATIYYTTDSSTPTTASTIYTGTINVNQYTVLKAIALASGYGQSAVATASYSIVLNQPAGASALGYSSKVYSFAPQVSDIAIGGGVNASDYPVTKKFSNGYAYNFGNSTVSPPLFWTNAACATTAQGVISLNALGGAVQPGGIFGEMPQSHGTAGALGYIVAANGFYVECTYAISDGSSDHWDFFGIYPQEKDANSHLAYLENDIQEGGFDTTNALQTAVSWSLSSAGAKQNQKFNDYNQGATLDRTQFHRYGFSYDPIGMVIKFYIDDVVRSTVSTNQTDTYGNLLDNSIKNYHYWPAVIPQSHGQNLAYSQFVSNLQLWIPSTVTQVFSYPSGFTGAASSFSFNNTSYGSVGSTLSLVGTGIHQGNGCWYNKGAQTVTGGFQIQFTFTMGNSGTVPTPVEAFSFCVQNSNTTTNPNAFGISQSGTAAGGDANLGGVGSYSSNWQNTGNPTQGIGNSVEIVFVAGSVNSSQVCIDYPAVAKTPSAVGLYINGGPYASFLPTEDLNPAGLLLFSGHKFSAFITYDGSSLLTMVLTDTVTGASGRYSWPVDIQTVLGSSSGIFGWTAGAAVTQNTVAVNSATLWTGRYPLLAAPTFSVAGGQYSAAQSVTISASAGATIYYTTNGKNPTAASTQYSGAISISSNTVLKAVAIQSGFTDSAVTIANYLIQASGQPTINMPSGLNANLVIPNGAASIVSGVGYVTDANGNSNSGELGALWYAAPVTVSGNWSTSFQIQIANASASGCGMAFVLQNKPVASTYTAGTQANGNNAWGVGGIHALGNFGGHACGYAASTGQYGQITGLPSSLAVIFDALSNCTGVYKNGADPSVSQTAISGVTLGSNHPLNVTISYNASTLVLSLSITDTVTSANFSTTFSNVNPSTAVGGTMAYAGFTGSTSYCTYAQEVKNWTGF